VIFHVLTLFPEFFRGPFDYGVIHRAREAGLIEIRVHDLRDWTHDRHKTVDDRPFGGGEGMLLKAGPIFEAVESIWAGRGETGADPVEKDTLEKDVLNRDVAQHVTNDVTNDVTKKDAVRKVALLSAQGRKFDQAMAREFSGLDELLLICGRYEGVDERVAGHLADEEISIGDFVLSGGELAAALVIDSVARLVEGVLGNEQSAVGESFGENGLLDCPQYTRPAEFRGWKAPEVLLSGNHEQIRRWRLKAALEKTARCRPDLLKRDLLERDLLERDSSEKDSYEQRSVDQSTEQE
jgi:tRNA (guanine37-N1)-methyltransferase